GADVAYSDWQYLVEDDSGFKPGDIVSRTMESVDPDPQIAVFTDFWCPPAAILYSRRIVEKIGKWDETLPIIQDARFLWDATLHGATFSYVPGVGALYRVHLGQSFSRLSKQKFVRDCLENALQIEAYWRQNGGITSQRSSAILKVLAFVTRASFESDPG